MILSRHSNRSIWFWKFAVPMQQKVFLNHMTKSAHGFGNMIFQTEYGSIFESAGNHIVIGEPIIRAQQDEITSTSHLCNPFIPASIGTELDITYIIMPHRSPDAGVLRYERFENVAKPCFHQKPSSIYLFTGAFSVQALANGAQHVTSSRSLTNLLGLATGEHRTKFSQRRIM